MLIPIGTVKNVPVTVLCVSQEPPVAVDGHVIHFDGRKFEIDLGDAQPLFEEGAQLLLDFGEGEIGRRRTRVEQITPPQLVVSLLGAPRRRERRFFPRIEGYVNLEFQVLPPDARDKMEDWLRHPHLSEATVDWIKPDPFIDFSATGLRFQSRSPVEDGSWLNIRFKLPMLGDEIHHCGGFAVRSFREEDLYSIAVAFVDVSDKVSDALMEYTKRCQDLLLGLDSLHDE